MFKALKLWWHIIMLFINNRYSDIQNLGDLRDPRAVGPLIKSLKKLDSDRLFSQAVAEALIKIGASSVHPLIYVLTSNGFYEEARKSAAFALGKLGPAAFEPLMNVVSAGNSYGLSYAIDALGDIGDRRAVNPLIGLLKNDNYHVRLSAVKALGKLGDGIAVAPLIKTTNDNDAIIRDAAKQVLIQMGDPKSEDYLINLLQTHESSRTEEDKIVLALKQIATPKAIRAIHEYFIERNTAIAARALGDLHYQPAFETIMSYFEGSRDNNSDVQNACAEALGEFANPRAVEILIKKLNNPWLCLSKNIIIRALGKIKDRSVIPQLVKVIDNRNDFHDEEIAAAIDILVAFGKEAYLSAQNTIINRLKHSNKYEEKTILASIRAIEAFQDFLHVDELSPYHYHRNKEIQEAAKKTYTALNPRKWQTIHLLNKEELNKIRSMIDSGRIVAEFKGNGGCCGDAIILKVKQIGTDDKSEFTFKIPPGTLLHSSNPNEQDMIIHCIHGEVVGYGSINPSTEIHLLRSKEVTYVLESYCVNFSKANPSPETRLYISDYDPELAYIIKESSLRGYKKLILQAAIWIMMDNITFEEMRQRIHISSIEWEKGQEIVRICNDMK